MKYNKSVYISGALLYFFTGPFFSWPFLRVTGIKIFLYFLFGFLCYRYTEKKSGFDKGLIGLFVFTSVLFGLTSPNNYMIKLVLCVSFLPVVVAPFCKDSYIKNVYSVFETIFVFVMAGSILCYIASLVGLLGPLWSMNGLISELGDKAYDVYGLCVKQNIYDTIRFYGPYDEPGVIGTYASLMLVINKINLRSLKNWVLLISGILSLSLFFFVIIGIYLLYSAVFHKQIIPILLLLCLIPYVYEQTKDDLEIQWRVWRRFTVSDGKFEGDDRSSESLDRFYKSKQYTWDYWFGVGDIEKAAQYMEGDSSYKIVVLRNGMIFFVLYCLFFILYGYKYLKKDRWAFFLYLTIFIGCMYQRTNVYAIETVFLFCFFARFYSDKSHIEDRRKITLQANERFC